MASPFDLISAVVPGKDSWRLKVRVARIWEVPTFLKPEQTNSLEMVLIDEKGCTIHASVRKQLLYVFQQKLKEGDVYKMSYFSVAPCVGSYRPTLHPYKLLFQMKTKVQASESSRIPQYGLCVRKIGEVCGHTVDYDHLVDIIGVMTGISAEREYVRDGKVTKMIVIELTDDSGKVECALFGSYVDLLLKLMGKSANGMPVVVLQFVKVKIFRDKVSLQNVLNATRILINPDIDEVVKFKEGIAVHGIEQTAPVPVIGPRIRPSLEEEFVVAGHRVSLAELDDVVDDGDYVVGAIVDGLVEGDDWWYPACRCHRGVTPDSGAYYCKGCVKHVFQMVPRYKVKIRVGDGDGSAVFVVFDGDMQNLLGKQCSDLVSAAKAENAGFYPDELLKLKGMYLLFKVEKSSAASVLFDGSYRVRRICSDAAVIESFTAQAGVCVDDQSKIVPNTSDVSGVGEVADGVGCKDDGSGVVGIESSVAQAAVSVDGQSKAVPGPSDVNGVIEIADDSGCEDDDADCVEETQAEEFAASVLESPISPRGFGRMVDCPPNAKVGGDSVDCTISLGDDDQTIPSDLLSVSDVLVDMFPSNSVKRNLSVAFEEVDVLEASMPTKSAKSGDE